MVVLSEHCSLVIVVIVVIFVSPTHPSPQPHSPPRPVCHTCSTLPPLHHYSARWEPLDLYIILQTNPTLSRENHNILSHIENHLTSVTFSAILQTHLIPYLLWGKMSLSYSQQNTAPRGPMLLCLNTPDQNCQV